MDSVLRLLNRDHAWSAAFFSMIFTIIVVYNDEVINSDGIRYMESARLFLEQGWAAGFKHYSWPFYTLLIAGVSKLLFIELETAAYVLNTLFLGLLGFAFVRCIRELGGDKKVTLAAAILFLCHVTLNEFRDLIVRDFGYLAFSFFAVYLLLRHRAEGQYRHAIGAGLAMLVAALFRIEGAVFLAFAPLALFWQSTPLWERMRSCLLVWTPAAIIVLVGVVLVSTTVDTQMLSGDRLTETVKLSNNTLAAISKGIEEKARILETTVLRVYARDMGVQSVIAIMVMILLSNLMAATGLLTPALLIWGLRKESIRNKVNSWSVPVWLILINLGILFAFVVTKFFLVNRYVLYFSLLVSLLAAFPLAEILYIDKSTINSRYLKTAKGVRVALIVLLVYMLGDGLTSFSSDRAYVRETAQWLNKNATNATILSNEEHMYYYTGRIVPWVDIRRVFFFAAHSEIPDIDPLKYDYLIFAVGRKQQDYAEKLKNWLGKEPVFATKNKRGEALLVFKMHT